LDDVWTFEVTNGFITHEGENMPVKEVKIIACNSKKPEGK